MPHQPLALVNARLVDPAALTETRGGVLVSDGVIAGVGEAVRADVLPESVRVIDCRGDIVAPGLVDLSAFVGEPGAEHRETIATATAAAAAGGVTTIVANPATNPPIDDPAVVDFLLRRARDTGRVRVLPAAALTKGLAGKEIAEIGLLQAAGAVAFTDGSRSVASAQVLRRALTYARDFDALVMHATEDRELVGEGVMNEGEFASRLGLAGIPREAETIMLDRDLRLVALTRARYHAALVTTTLSLERLAEAKERGLTVTAATSINHVTLNETDIGDYRTFLNSRRRCGTKRSVSRSSRRSPPASSIRSSPITIRRTSRRSACRLLKPNTAPSGSRRCSLRACVSSIPATFRCRSFCARCRRVRRKSCACRKAG